MNRLRVRVLPDDDDGYYWAIEYLTGSYGSGPSPVGALVDLAHALTALRELFRGDLDLGFPLQPDLEARQAALREAAEAVRAVPDAPTYETSYDYDDGFNEGRGDALRAVEAIERLAR